ncbi:NAD-dependent epimerase/dehydratase family protein [Candidatus Micrarchaeota archaeon]|nr:NAD-dependent epimerase/dehydratase family protein [Candidatus Micrarchaeota archaeon]
MSALKVGIIGFRGFVGSAFYECFSSDKKYEVIGIDKNNYETHKGSQFYLLINANGNSSKPLGDKDPSLDFDMNATGTLRFLRDFPSEHYLHVSSVEVYADTSSPERTGEDAAINPLLLSNYGFSKYMGELLAKRQSASWLIVRLAGLVGKNMKKGPAYDIMESSRLFVSESSSYQYLNTMDVASITKSLAEGNCWNQTYNVAGKGSIRLSEIARMCNAKLLQSGSKQAHFNVSCAKLESKMCVPTTRETIGKFVQEWKTFRQ